MASSPGKERVPTLDMARSWHVGVDVGGTFTDAAAFDGTSWRFAKVLSTPQAPEEGILDALHKIQAAPDLSAFATLVHGSTIVPNAVIERKGARTALLVTRGFRDVLSIGREYRFDTYDLSIEKPAPLAEREHIFEIDERSLSDGAVLRQVDDHEVGAIVQALRRAEIASVAIVFLHSYLNPQNEKRARSLIAAEWPELIVSCSHEVTASIGEYVRANTTVTNAYVRPVVRAYLRKLSTKLAQLSFRGRLFLMFSQGATVDAGTAEQLAVNLLEGGTSAGAIAASQIGAVARERDIVSFDVGGTTAKVCVCLGGRLPRARELEIARQRRLKPGSGLPVRIDGIEMLEIGAGGGSIARVDEAGWLCVGPESAGSVPGPACYGRGGELPTVTDANLMLGYFDPDGFAGGAMRLSRSAATAALSALGRRLSADVQEVAASILDLVNAQMASAVRVHIIERGGDPEKATLIAFGGGGPIHAYEVARLVGCRRIIVPPRAGVASAIGLLLTPPAIERSLALHFRVADDDHHNLLRSIGALHDSVQDELRERYGQARAVDLTCFAEMLYVGQGHEIVVQLPRDILDPADRTAFNERLRQAFEAEYKARGLQIMSAIPVLMTRITLRGALDRFVDSPPGIEVCGSAHRPTGRRSVYFAEAKDRLEATVLARAEMTKGRAIAGPALIEEADTTTVVGPSAQARLDFRGNVVIDMFSPGADPAAAL